MFDFVALILLFGYGVTTLIGGILDLRFRAISWRRGFKSSLIGGVYLSVTGLLVSIYSAVLLAIHAY